MEKTSCSEKLKSNETHFRGLGLVIGWVFGFLLQRDCLVVGPFAGLVVALVLGLVFGSIAGSLEFLGCWVGPLLRRLVGCFLGWLCRHDYCVVFGSIDFWLLG